jgi:hypothetical protein
MKDALLELWEDFDILFIAIGIAIAICLCLWVGDYLVTTQITQGNKVFVALRSDVIYEGKRAYINIESGGDTTIIEVYSSLFPFRVTEATYCDKELCVLSADNR